MVPQESISPDAENKASDRLFKHPNYPTQIGIANIDRTIQEIGYLFGRHSSVQLDIARCDI